jgi:Lrp/AsnC family transcriptional regulator for asnA, asnC and gidA
VDYPDLPENPWSQSSSAQNFDVFITHLEVQQRFPSLRLANTGETRHHQFVATRIIDDVSKAIIEHLQADGRTSYATIARSVGLSEAAVRARVQRLLDGKVMQIVAVTDPLQLGFTRQAMVGVRAEGDTRLVADKLADMAEVSYVVTTAGSFDLLVEVVCEDDDELLDLVSRRIRSLPGVVSTETFVYLKLNKQHYNWGTR